MFHYYYLPTYLPTYRRFFLIFVQKEKNHHCWGLLVQMTGWLHAWQIWRLFSRCSCPWGQILQVPMKNNRSSAVEAKTFWGGLYPFFQWLWGHKSSLVHLPISWRGHTTLTFSLWELTLSLGLFGKKNLNLGLIRRLDMDWAFFRSFE